MAFADDYDPYTITYAEMSPKGHKFGTCGCFRCKQLRAERDEKLRVMREKSHDPISMSKLWESDPRPNTLATAHNILVSEVQTLSKYVKRVDSTVGDHDNRLDLLEGVEVPDNKHTGSPSGSDRGGELVCTHCLGTGLRHIDPTDAEKREDKCEGNPFYCSCVYHQDAREAMGLKRLAKSPEEILNEVVVVLDLQLNQMDKARNDLAMRDDDSPMGNASYSKMLSVEKARADLRNMARNIYGLLTAPKKHTTIDWGGCKYADAQTGCDYCPLPTCKPVYEIRDEHRTVSPQLWGYSDSEIAFSNDAKFPIEDCNCDGCTQYRKEHPKLATLFLVK